MRYSILIVAACLGLAGLAAVPAQAMPLLPSAAAEAVGKAAQTNPVQVRWYRYHYRYHYRYRWHRWRR